jgi:hypothetical protein
MIRRGEYPNRVRLNLTRYQLSEPYGYSCSPASHFNSAEPTLTKSLTRVRIDELSQLGIFLLVNEALTLKDVRTMVSLSELYSSARIVERIVGNQYP